MAFYPQIERFTQANAAVLTDFDQVAYQEAAAQNSGILPFAEMLILAGACKKFNEQLGLEVLAHHQNYEAAMTVDDITNRRAKADAFLQFADKLYFAFPVTDGGPVLPEAYAQADILVHSNYIRNRLGEYLQNTGEI